MKFIDGKGRLFEKINIADFLIIILILTIIWGFFGIYKILGRRPRRTPNKLVRVEAFSFICAPEIAELLKVGDVAYDEEGNPDAKLLRIYKKNEKNKDRMLGYFKKHVREEWFSYATPLFLEFKLLCAKDAKNQLLYYRENPFIISVEKNFLFETDKYQLSCYLIRIYEEEDWKGGRSGLAAF